MPLGDLEFAGRKSILSLEGEERHAVSVLVGASALSRRLAALRNAPLMRPYVRGGLRFYFQRRWFPADAFVREEL